MLGQAAKVAPYYAGPDVRTPKTARAGLDFLLEAPAERRWLVFGAKDLGTLNQLYRQNATPPSNLPVLDAISSEVLLASNRLLSGETNQNPLAAWIGSERPTPARRPHTRTPSSPRRPSRGRAAHRRAARAAMGGRGGRRTR